MKERPILFSGPMVRAILAGRKTQTRRVVKPAPPEWCGEAHHRGAADWYLTESPIPFNAFDAKCPYGQPGDRLWVRENYRIKLSDDRWVNYPASGEHWQRWMHPQEPELEKLAQRKRHVGLVTPGRFMYRSLSRLTLEVVSVWVESLSEITEADAIAEGIEKSDRGYLDYHWEQKRGQSLARGWFSDPVLSYRSLWETINGPGSWDANPWVWVVEFKRVETQTA